MFFRDGCRGLFHVPYFYSFLISANSIFTLIRFLVLFGLSSLAWELTLREVSEVARPTRLVTPPLRRKGIGMKRCRSGMGKSTRDLGILTSSENKYLGSCRYTRV